MCCLMSDKNQAAIGKDRYTVTVLAELVNPLAKRLDIVEQDVKHCILVNVAVEVLVASLECYQCLVSIGRDLKLLDRRGLDGVTSMQE